MICTVVAVLILTILAGNIDSYSVLTAITVVIEYILVLVDMIGCRAFAYLFNIKDRSLADSKAVIYVFYAVTAFLNCVRIGNV